MTLNSRTGSPRSKPRWTTWLLRCKSSKRLPWASLSSQKVALGQFVQKVEETTDGLTITYGDGTVLTVHVSTGSGAGTLSVVKNAAGDLCWAIDGVILQYEGKDLLVGAVSNIYVENGKLYAVINGQAKELGGFSGGSELKDGIFTAVAVTDEAVVLTLSDNSTIKLPLANAFKLVIAKTKYAVTTTEPPTRSTCPTPCRPRPTTRWLTSLRTATLAPR